MFVWLGLEYRTKNKGETVEAQWLLLSERRGLDSGANDGCRKDPEAMDWMERKVRPSTGSVGPGVTVVSGAATVRLLSQTVRLLLQALDYGYPAKVTDR